MYDTQILPIILYCSEIWGVHEWRMLESFHVKFCKYVLGVGVNSTNAAVLSECGRHNLVCFTILRCVKYWCKLLCMNDTRYPKQCYIMLTKLDNSGRETWVSHIRKIICLYGFSYAWEFQNIINIDMFVKQFSQRIIDCNSQSILSELNDHSNLDFYSSVKESFKTESYLSTIRNKDLRRFLTLLRIGELNIMKNNGRKNNVPRELRLCPFCKDELEDELHFMFLCPLYNDLRKKYMSNVKYKTIQSLIDIMQTGNVNDVYLYAKFIKDAFNLRCSLL